MKMVQEERAHPQQFWNGDMGIQIIRLPSGREVQVKDMPEGTSREEMMQRIVGAGMATVEDFHPAPDIAEAAQEAVQQVAAETSSAEAVAVGAGETVTRWGRGLADLLDQIPLTGMSGEGLPGGDVVADQSQATTEQLMESRADRATADLRESRLMEPMEQEHEWATETGRLLPYVATAAIPGSWAARSALGATGGGLDYRSEDRMRDAAIGAVAPILMRGLGGEVGRLGAGIAGIERAGLKSMPKWQQFTTMLGAVGVGTGNPLVTTMAAAARMARAPWGWRTGEVFARTAPAAQGASRLLLEEEEIKQAPSRRGAKR